MLYNQNVVETTILITFLKCFVCARALQSISVPDATFYATEKGRLVQARQHRSANTRIEGKRALHSRNNIRLPLLFSCLP